MNEAFIDLVFRAPLGLRIPDRVLLKMARHIKRYGCDVCGMVVYDGLIQVVATRLNGNCDGGGRSSGRDDRSGLLPREPGEPGKSEKRSGGEKLSFVFAFDARGNVKGTWKYRTAVSKFFPFVYTDSPSDEPAEETDDSNSGFSSLQRLRALQRLRRLKLTGAV